jgi:hypothetical protein
MCQTKSHKLLVHDLVSGLNPRLSYSAENLPDSQAFGLLSGYLKKHRTVRVQIAEIDTEARSCGKNFNDMLLLTELGQKSVC